MIELGGALSGGLNESQDAKARAAFRELVSYAGDKPQFAMQYRANAARTALIIEALFDDLPAKAAVVNRLAAQLGVAVGTVNTALTFTLFGGSSATWEQSRAAARTYLAQSGNRAAWGDT